MEKVNDKRRINPDTLEIKEPASIVMSLAVEDANRKINEQRMEVINAFVAKHGCQPDECEQIVQPTLEGIKWFIRKREA